MNYSSKERFSTCTIATLKNIPRRPVAMEQTAIRLGPARNFIAMANTAFWVPHGIILACEAIKRPNREHRRIEDS